MFRIVVSALACAASAVALSAPAQAVRFSYNFTAPLYTCWSWDDGESGCDANSTVSGSGFLTADDNGDGTFAITGATGQVVADVGDPAGAVTDFGGGAFGSLDPTITLVDGAYQLDNLTLFYNGQYSPQFLSLSRQDDGSLGGLGMDFTSAIGVTFDVAPAPSAAPEVATWGLMLLGFGATGAAMRRRRAAVTFA